VAPEDAHEPGKAGRRQRAAGNDSGMEPERGKIDQTVPVDPSQRLPVAAEGRRALQPGFEVLASLGPRLISAWAEADRPHPTRSQHDLHLEPGAPLAVWLDTDVEGHALVVRLCGA